MASLDFDRTLRLGTDVAGFFLFHPDDLTHRFDSPLAWYCSPFALSKEYDAGKLITFGTGGDGGYRFRLTTGSLTKREQQWHAGSWEYRLRVGRGRVLIDNGDCLPNDDLCDEVEDDDERWIDLPKGDYRVTVHALEWYSEPDALDENGYARSNALPAFVIHFEPVEDISRIPVKSNHQPFFDGRRDSPPSVHSDESVDAGYEEEKGPPGTDTFVLLGQSNWLIVPGFYRYLSVGNEIYEAVFGAKGSTLLPNRIRDFVLAPPKANSGQLGMLTQAGSAGRSGEESWSMAFSCMRLVRVTKRFQLREWEMVQIEAIERPSETVSSAALHALKLSFLNYAMSNETYRNTATNPDFEAERVEWMTSPEAITNCLIHHVQMPDARRMDLLLLSDAQRISELRQILADE